MRWTLLLSLLVGGLGARAEAAVVGQELVLDGSLLYPFNGMDGGADVLFDGTSHLVVWSAFAPQAGEARAAYAVLGARFTVEGAFIGANYLAAAGTGPSVAFDGTSYLVVWEDRSVDVAADIVAARIRPADLMVLDAPPIVIARGCQARQGLPRVAFDGMTGTHLVVWQDERNAGSGADVYAARVRAADGVVLDPQGVLVAGDAGSQGAPAVAAVVPQPGEPSFEVAWLSTAPGAQGARVRAARVSAGSGAVSAVQDVSSAASADPELALALTSDRLGGHVVVWTDTRAGNRDLWAARLDGAGQPAGGEVALATDPVDEDGPRAVLAGAEIVVAHARTEAGMRGTRVLVLSEPDNGTLMATPFALPAVAAEELPLGLSFGSPDYLLVRQLGSGASALAVRTRLHADLRGDGVGDGALATPHASAQGEPAVAFGAGRFLSLFTDDGTDRARRGVVGRLVSSGGEVMATLRLGSAGADAIHPAVASSDAGFLVVWADRRNDPEVSQCAPPAATPGLDLYGARVGADGSMLGTEQPIARQMGHQSRPAIASDGRGYLVIWEDGRNQSYTDLYGARLDLQTGAVVGQEFAVVRGDGDHTQPALAWNGTSYLLVWSDARNRGTSGLDVYGLRLDASGGRLGSEIPIATAAGDQRDPQVASDGVGFLVAWSSARPEGDTDVYAARIDAAGSVLDAPIAIEASPVLAEQGPRVAFDGTHYVVASVVIASGTQSAVLARRVTTLGVLVDTQGISLSPATPSVDGAAIASDRLGNTLVPFSGFDPAPMVQSMRARAVLLTSLPRGATCANAEQCASGQCQGLVCVEGADGAGGAGSGGTGGAAGAAGNAASLPNARYRPGCSTAGAERAPTLPLALVLALGVLAARRGRVAAPMPRRATRARSWQ